MSERDRDPLVAIVVVSWNGSRLLPACLDSLRRQTYAPRVIIVVDNASSDDSAQIVRQHYSEVTLIEHQRNVGFAEGCNSGIRHALQLGAKYVVALNQDTEVAATWLDELVRVANTDTRIGAVGSRMLLATHRTLLNSTGIEVNYLGYACDRGFGRVDGACWQQPSEVLGVTGGAMFLSAEALRCAGLFDPDYFAYYEDLDLSVRLWEAGHRLVYAPAAVVYHHYSASFGSDSAHKLLLLESNRFRFLLKHFPITWLLWQLPALLNAEVRFAAYRVRRGGFNAALLCLRGYARAAVRIASIMRYRWVRRRAHRDRACWWRFVTPRYGFFDIFVPRVDFRLATREADACTDRVLMGVTDNVLGEGWYPLTKPGGGWQRNEGPAGRCFGRSATCFLRVAGPGSYVLQLHVSHPHVGPHQARLHVSCNGTAVGSRAIETRCGQWHTLRFPIELERATAMVRLLVENPVLREDSGHSADVGLLVNEVSLLRADSAFVRQDPPCAVT